MTSASPMISLSIVSHGQLDLARRAVESLARFPPRVPFEILVTENVAGAKTETKAWALPVALHTNPRPQGLAANQNAAVARSRGEFVCLLNPDVVFVEDVFGPLLIALQGGADLVAPTIVDSEGAVQESGRLVPTPWRLIRRRLRVGRGRPAKTPARPDWIAGTFLLLHADTFSRLGGMDERIRLYFEDVDLGCRATLAGMSLWIDPKVHVVHEARRASAHSAPYLFQHAVSAVRFFRSPVYRAMRERSRGKGSR
ncbi:MAG: glycosyltransferase [Anaerolineales bacterium]